MSSESNVKEFVKPKPANKAMPNNISSITQSQNKLINVLLVDDDLLIEIVIKKMLEDECFNVDFASSAAEALIMVSQNNYDIILMDIIMPEFTGTDAMLKIRKHIDKTTTKIIAHTFSENKYINLGFDGQLLKPVKKNVLIENIKSLLV
ncbi:response regulator [Pseudoalteromonas sp. BSi20495]|uniref:response regulator n=1 Tax=Pseudoalteromonas sp. BSi20495 TaxID=386429 RepID=UPI0002315BEA|nr:response regulator [Pseudoalteromonas sp. BSi20495]GAA77667.1 signal transduction histidine kinase [Pseudoalteromonas sp. BSi20495]